MATARRPWSSVWTPFECYETMIQNGTYWCSCLKLMPHLKYRPTREYANPTKLRVFWLRLLTYFAKYNVRESANKNDLTIWGADPVGSISTKIGKVVVVRDVIIHSNFGFNIFRGFRSTGDRNFRLPIDFAGHRYISADATAQPVMWAANYWYKAVQITVFIMPRVIAAKPN